MSLNSLRARCEHIRAALDPVFRPDTAAKGANISPASSGHCAAVAAILHRHLGGELVSALVHGQSHWYNRLPVDKGFVDVDLTGDQFGFHPIQITTANSLYPGSRVRAASELNNETMERSIVLEKRAGLANG